jgi:peroxiredoxin
VVLVAVLAACTGRTGDAAAATKVAASAAEPDGFKPLTVGDSAPFFRTVTLAGDSVHIGGTTNPVTVLNVWATWCASCREEMADLEGLQQEFAGKGVRVLAVSVDVTDVARVRQFVSREKLTFNVAHDPDGIVQQLYRVVGIPETYVIGKDGRVAWKSVGNVHGVVDSLRTVLRASLAHQ